MGCRDRLRGEVSIEPHGAPGSAAGTALLVPTRNGSRLKCNATVEFKVPLVGGTIESMLTPMQEHSCSEILRHRM